MGAPNPSKPSERIGFEQALFLYQSAGLMDLASLVRWGPYESDEIYYSKSAYLRIPVNSDLSCHSQLDELVTGLRPCIREDTSEIKIGSIHPERVPYKGLLALIASLNSSFKGIPIKGLCASVILKYAFIQNRGLRHILGDLKQSGLSVIEGRGAGLFFSDRIGQYELDSWKWLQTHRAIHRSDLVSEATLIYGRGESLRDRLTHLFELRRLQDETGGFSCFLPLSHHYQEPDTGFHRTTPGLDDLRMVAISRLVLDNISHLRIPMGRLGLDMTQLCLPFGVNEIEGFVDTATPDRMRSYFRSASSVTISRLVYKAGKTPVAKTRHYDPIMWPESKPKGSKFEMLLLKAENGETLSDDEMLEIANDAPLTVLTQCSMGTKSDKADPKLSYTLATVVEALELATNEHTMLRTCQRLEDRFTKFTGKDICLSLCAKPIEGPIGAESWKNLLRNILKIHTRFPSVTINYQGLKSFWQWSHFVEQKLDKTALDLMESGITWISSHPDESLEDLTDSELRDLYHAISKAQLRLSAKLELSATFDGSSRPFWDQFIDDLNEIKTILKTCPEMTDIAVESVPKAKISPVEYFKAAALTKTVLGQQIKIVAPFSQIPSANSWYLNKRNHARTRDILKLATLCGHFGIDSIGILSENSPTTQLIMKEFNKAGVRLVRSKLY